MAEYLTMGCMLTCSMGTTPMPFVTQPLPGKTLHMESLPVGLITDVIPMTNIPSFAMCNASLNPTVIAATAAAMGVKTPGACLPVITSPWAPPSLTETYQGVPIAMASSKCLCAYGGTISVSMPNDMTSTGKP